MLVKGGLRGGTGVLLGLDRGDQGAVLVVRLVHRGPGALRRLLFFAPSQVCLCFGPPSCLFPQLAPQPGQLPLQVAAPPPLPVRFLPSGSPPAPWTLGPP